MNKEIRQGIQKALVEKLEVALVTVIQTMGSTPRETGAKMLVFSDGTTLGTVGGGCGEPSEAGAFMCSPNMLPKNTP